MSWNIQFIDNLVLLLSSLLGYEGLEVVNPEGGTEDAEAEAKRGRWKQEVTQFLCMLCL